MAEVNKEKQHISLNICDEKLDIYVKSDEETLAMSSTMLRLTPPWTCSTRPAFRPPGI